MGYQNENEQQEKELKVDKTKQVIALTGGFLSAIYSFLLTLSVTLDWFTPESINAFVALLAAAIPFVLTLYGVYKNTYVLREKSKKQEEFLIRKGLK